ncbi:hypothetical protein VP01_843g2 [Puccinia sorghi]|uniref:Uncharacterized protein n=1 Tax=Puccinia sorghi TaxID=27349 RepID=A0A0L6U9A0_9BASI|nr:hypothetical protein VP01_843g2 [Puccinia sorghi]
MNCTVRLVEIQASDLNQVIKTYEKFWLATKFALFGRVVLVFLSFCDWRCFYSYSQCDHNIKKEYQSHKMVTISDMSCDHFNTKNKSLSMSHIIFLSISHSLLEVKYNFKKNWMSKRYIRFILQIEFCNTLEVTNRLFKKPMRKHLPASAMETADLSPHPTDSLRQIVFFLSILYFHTHILVELFLRECLTHGSVNIYGLGSILTAAIVSIKNILGMCSFTRPKVKAMCTCCLHFCPGDFLLVSLFVNYLVQCSIAQLDSRKATLTVSWQFFFFLISDLVSFLTEILVGDFCNSICDKEENFCDLNGNHKKKLELNFQFHLINNLNHTSSFCFSFQKVVSWFWCRASPSASTASLSVKKNDEFVYNSCEFVISMACEITCKI